MMINIDGTVIFDEKTGNTICDIEEISNMEQAKEIILKLIEENEELQNDNEDKDIEIDRLNDEIMNLTMDSFEF